MSSVMAGRRDIEGGDRREQPGLAEDGSRTAASGGGSERSKQNRSRQANERISGGAAAGGAADLAPGSRLALQARLRAGKAGPVLRLFPSASHRDHVVAACDGVIDIAAALFDVSGKDLRGPGRSTLAVSRVRQIAMYVAHVTLGFTMANVGQGFGRDRTTVLHACHQIEDMREDEEFDGIVARVEQVIAAAFGEAA